MKILSVGIPCYNSAEYMRRAIDSIIPCGEDVEIIVVDDGSSDDTFKIGKEYEEKYPGIVKAVTQPNGGHGSAVNTGLYNATGMYYKVLDSDDWFDTKALCIMIDTIKNFCDNGTKVDMFIANYVYENQNTGKQKVINYHGAMPEQKVFTWADMGHFKVSQNILMHSVIYRTDVLRKCRLELPKHTFYVDNIFVYTPLPYVNTIYYLDIDLYRYYIGRTDQSVNEDIMQKRIDQQIKITKIMIDAHNLPSIKDDKLRKYMTKYLTMMMTVSSVFLVRENTKESLEKRDELWKYLRNSSPETAKLVNKCLLGRPMQMKSYAGRKIIIYGYRLSRRIYGFS